ncbi:uncharacterized protein LOC143031837 [Oratosquilla oratoria]|uniref:uncharacterized protein LOC143031837 n=1 Tax=Oratosquilla oratoria TaxID=337810 RepID=UPI003F77301E
MLMFCDQLEYDEETVAKLERLTFFLALFCTSMRMRMSTSAVDAPVNDLQLIQDMLSYKRSDPEVAEAVLPKMENHKRYLTQEPVPFMLFSSSRLSDKQKQDIAAQLHATQKPDSFRRGKPVFQKVTAKTTLVDLIGPEFHLLLDILSIGPAWLLDHVESWPEKEDYKKALEYVRNLRVEKSLGVDLK